MSLEEALRENTAALIANTEAHAKLAAVASAAAASGSAAESPAKDDGKTDSDAEAKKAADAEAKKKAAAEKRKATAAKKKAEAEKKAAEAPDLSKLADGVTADKLKTLAGGFLKGDDEEARDANKEKFMAALAHLGASKLTEVDSDEDRAKLAAYIVYWSKGAEVDFEAVDEIVLGIIDGGDGDDDDLLG